MENQDIKPIPDSLENSNLTQLLNNSSDTIKEAFEKLIKSGKYLVNVHLFKVYLHLAS